MALNQRTKSIVVSLDEGEYPFTSMLEIQMKVKVDYETGDGSYYYTFNFVRPDTGVECVYEHTSREAALDAAEAFLLIRHRYDVLNEEVNKDLTFLADTKVSDV
jgi:hypothetical protein